MRETGKETQMKDTTMKDTTRATISRRELVTAASIVPFAAVRGSAQNSAVTVGLIGCGGRGTHDGMTLAKNVPGARLVALADLFPEKIEAAKKAAGVPDAKAYSRDTELLAKSGVDAVIIATPVFLHPEHLEAAVRAGKHIYIEKPAGADVAGGRRRLGGPQARHHLRVPAALRRRVPEGEKAGRVERHRADCHGSFLLGEESGGLRAPDGFHAADNGAGDHEGMAPGA